jgi:hypothetical protein
MPGPSHNLVRHSPILQIPAHNLAGLNFLFPAPPCNIALSHPPLFDLVRNIAKDLLLKNQKLIKHFLVIPIIKGFNLTLPKI